MSWFSQVNQSSGHQQPTDSQRLAHIQGSAAPAALGGGPGLFAPALADFPSAPRGAASPLSLENLSCASPSVGQGRELEPISYVTLQEQRCVLSWFQGWTATQRERFLHDLLGKAVPGKVCTLLDSLSTLQVKDKLPNIFECQLRLWTQWFESWREEERNHFLHMLEEQNPEFVAHFYRSVSGTAGAD
ncbi:unnamed protein product [Menidia menidia]|uniref:(Atlantic silverside) hypothetical protein n=1 Tax=Menidia menidia TaxID=238744 RepID=A0A8S4AWJ2_9TELE|nr:unnamed protein product [Menidia menidia]